MGLDSVMLAIEVEETFNIHFPDKEIEKVITVQDFADAVENHIQIYPSSKCITQKAFYCLRRGFEMIGDSRNEVLPSSVVEDLLPKENLENWWWLLETQIGWKLPKLNKTDLDLNLCTEVELFGLKVWSRPKPITKANLKTLIDWTLAVNYEEVFDRQKLKSSYEVQRIVAGIIHRCCAVEIDEIKLDSEIVNDFGIE